MPAFDPLKWFRTASTTSNWIPNLATNTESPGREGYVRGSSADCPANPNCGERGGTRTRDQLIKSQLLYRLSYPRSEEHTSELQSLMRIQYAVFCLKKKT